MVGGNTRLSYVELMQRSRVLGRELRELGARPNTLVAIVMEKGWEQVVAALGILQAGAAYVPIDSNLPRERMFQLLNNAEAGLILTQPCLDEALDWPLDIPRLCVHKTAGRQAMVGPLEPAQAPNDLAYVIYTSGSTSVPKGVMIDHQGAVNTILDINQRFGVSPQDKVLALSSLSFDLSVYNIFGMLAAGGTIVIPEALASRDAAHWYELALRESVTIWNSVPALMEMLTEHVSGCSKTLPPSLRLVLLSGDWIPLSLPDQIRTISDGIQLISMGGATEASIWSILYPLSKVDPAWKSIPYGRPMINQSVQVLNDLLEPCPVGLTGQLYIGGIGLAKGYWRDPEKTASKFIIHPQTSERLYQTGDFGRYLPGGDIEFLGREDYQVKIRGFRIELGEIEAALRSYPGVHAAVVTAQGKITAERRLIGYVVPGLSGNTGQAIEQPLARNAQPQLGFEAHLKEFLATKLPDYMIPSRIIALNSLPLTPNGKLDHQSLPKPVRIDVGPKDAKAIPRTEIEKVLAEIFQEVLKLDSVGIHDDFFAMGGDSLGVIQVVLHAEKQGYKVLPIMVLRHPTIAGLAAKAGVRSQPELVRLQEGDSGPDLIFLMDDYSLGLFKAARLLEQKFSSFASIVSIPRSILKAVVRKRFDQVPSLEQLAAEHASLITRRQSKRPVLLVGYCFGGLLAFEAARQLQRAGEQVAAVMMLDTWMTQPSRWWRQKNWLKAHLGKLLRQGPRYLWEKSRFRINRKKSDRVSRRQLMTNRGFGADMVPIINRMHRRIMDGYRPQILSSRGILVVSKDDWESKAYRRVDETLGSSRWFADGVQVWSVPGEHATLFDESHLPELARCFKTAFENVAGTSPVAS